MHRAGATLPVIAALFRAGEGDDLADAIEQSCARINSQMMILTVNAQGDWHSSLNIRPIGGCGGGIIVAR